MSAKHHQETEVVTGHEKQPSIKSKLTSSMRRCADEIDELLEKSEDKLEDLEKRLDWAAANLEAQVEDKLDDLEDHWKKADSWLSKRVKTLKAIKKEAQELEGTAVLKAHLGAMEARDLRGELVERLDHMKAKIDQLAYKTTAKTADGLKKISNACLRLREEIIR